MPVEIPAAGLSLSESHPLNDELSYLRALVACFQLPWRAACCAVVSPYRWRWLLRLVRRAQSAWLVRGRPAFSKAAGCPRLLAVAHAGDVENEAHTASINLQRHALDTSAYPVRIAQLEAENKLLRAELTILRDNPAPAREEARRSDAVVREYAGLVRRLEGRSPAAGRTSFVLDGHRRSASGTGNVDADAGSTPTLVEPPVPASSPSAGEGPKDALNPQAQLEKRDNTEALETRVAELTVSSSKLELALAASQTLVAELGT
ncbi:hypothetical protein B0H14DRAFT_3904743 [Mycena olivaceomarginata]|nr:hypothetical protein B0H14DRAFT_3904743 [Mycena olivaceomarginata]